MEEIRAQAGQEFGAGGALDAVVRPEPRDVGARGIRWVGDLEGRGKRGTARVVGGERDVGRGVPVLGCELEREREGEEGVYYGEDVTAVGYGEGAVLCGLGSFVLLLFDGEMGVVARQGGRLGVLTGGQKSSWTSTTRRAGLTGILQVLFNCGLVRKGEK